MANSDKNIRITGNKNTATGIFPKIVFTGAGAGVSVLTLEVRDDNTVAFTGLDGDVFSLDYNLSTGTIWSVNDKSGINLLSASAGATIGIAEYGNSILNVGSGNIGATSLSGTLLVKGGVGITGNAFIGGTTTITSIASATGASSGALVVYGGVGIGGSLYVNNSASFGGTISAKTNLDMTAANSIRFFNATSTFSTALKGGNNPANYTLTLPLTAPGAGVSVLVSDSAGTMSFPTISGVGISIIGSGTAITFSHSIPLTTYFCSGYTPNNTGADTVVFMVPFSVVDGTTSVNYNIRRVHMRVETPSAGTSTIKLEKYAFNAGTGVTVFSSSSVAVGSTANIMNPLGLSISGAAIAETFVTSASIGFSTGFATCVSGDKFRVNFTALNATHANFSISMNLDSVN
jgi:hypothetical protein